MGSLKEWADKWIELASFTGERLYDQDDRIEAVIAHWNEPVSADWMRGPDPRLHVAGERYGRGTKSASHVPSGEQLIEEEVLDRSAPVTSLGWTVVDGLNALPLTTNPGRGREGNVEADMLLLVQRGDGYALHVLEVKVSDKNPWYAAVESLRQLKLFSESASAKGVFQKRQRHLNLPLEMQITGIVLARRAYYETRWQKANSVEPAQRLLRRIGNETGITALLATWDSTLRAIEPL